ncbi:MAG: sulfotransferase domain-containing protein [Nitrococcus sp.]|nr:sulfotransferase domain-containing protein [Nitrococcus sp.]
MKMPNFFIVGAPRCGTTALTEYLRAHPRVYMSEPKEPHYFALDFPRYRDVTNKRDYQALFESANSTHSMIGEASVFYLYSQAAAKEIRKSLPASRLVVLLRNPLEVAVSMHAKALEAREENVEDFTRAWALCEGRRLGQQIPRNCLDAKALFYDRIPLLGQQLQRLLEIFPREQVGWWFYEDLLGNPDRMYCEVLDFLHLSHDGRTEFPRVNSSARARSQVFAQFTEKTPAPLRQGAMEIKRWLGIKRWGVLDTLRRINVRPARPPDLPPALIEEMRAHFTPDVRLLAVLTGRDLGHWLQEDA